MLVVEWVTRWFEVVIEWHPTGAPLSVRRDPISGFIVEVGRFTVMCTPSLTQRNQPHTGHTKDTQ